MKTLVVQVDSREKRPLLFPTTLKTWNRNKEELVRVQTERVKLDAGDYRLRGHEDRAVIERKGSVRELAQNLLTADQKRQGRAFRKLAEACEFPYLFLHTTATSLLAANEFNKDPERLVQKLAWVLGKFGFQFVLVPLTSSTASRRLVGSVALNLLVGHVESTL